MKAARDIAGQMLLRLDLAYHRWRRLRPVGPALYIGRERYAGPERRFGDGTRLLPGATIGTLHFNNARAAEFALLGRQRLGLRFGRLLRESMAELARLARALSAEGVEVYCGVTWLRPHGLQVGFVSEPVPAGWRRRLLAAHFGLLGWALGARASGQRGGRELPRVFWITHLALERHFGRDADAR